MAHPSPLPPPKIDGWLIVGMALIVFLAMAMYFFFPTSPNPVHHTVQPVMPGY